MHGTHIFSVNVPSHKSSLYSFALRLINVNHKQTVKAKSLKNVGREISQNAIAHHFDGLENSRGRGEEAPPQAGANPAKPATLEAVLVAPAGLGVAPPPPHNLPDHDRVAPTHLELVTPITTCPG